MKLSKLTVGSLFIASIVPFSSMADNTGTIDFTGTVINAPCNIEQTSLKQSIDFGQLSRKALEDGKTAEANFDIKFTGCDFSNFGEDGSGKAVAVKTMDLVFTGQNYADDKKTLLATSTANDNNLGIAIEGFEFEKPKNVLPNGNTQGDISLTFKALAKAVDATKTIAEGKFNAISNFRITYQ